MIKLISSPDMMSSPIFYIAGVPTHGRHNRDARPKEPARHAAQFYGRDVHAAVAKPCVENCCCAPALDSRRRIPMIVSMAPTAAEKPYRIAVVFRPPDALIIT